MICVDSLLGSHSHKWKYEKHCHLFHSYDDLTSLHNFAEKLGLKREWFQDMKRPHYDLTESKRNLALRLGARALVSMRRYPPT